MDSDHDMVADYHLSYMGMGCDCLYNHSNNRRNFGSAKLDMGSYLGNLGILLYILHILAIRDIHLLAFYDIRLLSFPCLVVRDILAILPLDVPIRARRNRTRLKYIICL